MSVPPKRKKKLCFRKSSAERKGKHRKVEEDAKVESPENQTGASEEDTAARSGGRAPRESRTARRGERGSECQQPTVPSEEVITETAKRNKKTGPSKDEDSVLTATRGKDWPKRRKGKSRENQTGASQQDSVSRSAGRPRRESRTGRRGEPGFESQQPTAPSEEENTKHRQKTGPSEEEYAVVTAISGKHRPKSMRGKKINVTLRYDKSSVYGNKENEECDCGDDNLEQELAYISTISCTSRDVGDSASITSPTKTYNQKWRSSMSPEKKQEERDKVRIRMARGRAIPKSKYVGRRIEQIFEGKDIIPAMNVGRLCDPVTGSYDDEFVTKCQYCDALRWKNEPDGICCNSGKVSLEPLFHDFPPELKDRFCDLDIESRQFRKHIVAINNSLSLCSLKVNRPTPPGGGYNPCVVMQGKPGYLIGPLKPANDQPPVFAQLYILDPQFEEQELDHRMACLYLPKSTSDSEKTRLRDLVRYLQAKLKTDWNPYVKDFMMACEIFANGVPQEVKLIIDAEKRPAGEHERRFNPGYSEISVVFNDADVNQNHDMVLKWRSPGNKIDCIPDTHRSVDAFRFILFFPTGADGWHTGLQQSPSSTKRLTGRMFYGYLMHVRSPISLHFSPLLRGCRLFQEYLCLAQAKIENQDLKYHAFNQKKLRADKYKHANDEFRAGEGDPSRIGQLKILPASFVGSPRYYHTKYQNAMALVRVYGKPSLFITMTCNPKWPEIVDSLLPGQNPSDRPELVARVFRLKNNSVHKKIKDGEIFGKVSAQVSKIEFQKRGLPHNHQLVIHAAENQIKTDKEVDQIISAELPPDPADFPEGSDARKQAERLLELVITHMTHACSKKCSDEKGNCTKHFPKEYCEETEWNEDDLYPKYRRRKGRTVEWRGKMYTNRDIVPYNPYLLLTYECHINVECCISVATIKYLYLYIHKGVDRVMIAPDTSDEIKNYQNYRSLGAMESAWRLLGFLLGIAWPPVIALRVHLEEEQTIYWTPHTIETVLKNEGSRRTELTAFFEFNQQHPGFYEKYVDFPRFLVYHSGTGTWNYRKRNAQIVGRIHTIHPASGDEYYLRMLLHHNHCKGKISFEDLRTIQGHTYRTYREVCQKLGLLQDDGEYDTFLYEAAAVDRSQKVRSSFVTILRYCNPESPLNLFENHWEEWNDDFKYKYPTATLDLLKTMVLLDLEARLQSVRKELNEFRLPVPSEKERNDAASLQNITQLTRESRAMEEQLSFDLEGTKSEHERQKALLNVDQRMIYDEIMDVLQNELNEQQTLERKESCCFFIDAKGGTGKTFLLSTIIAAARTLNNQKAPVLAVAYSGIAATLLPKGMTFHSMFKVPVNKGKAESGAKTFNIKPTDVLAKVIAAARLIVMDEGPMASRDLLEGLDETLRDILSNPKPFGGKVLIIAGDFRQILPVLKHASRAKIVESALNRSPLFKHFQIRKLCLNLRIGNDPQLQDFDNFLQDMGNGTIPIVLEPDWIRLPPEMIYEIDETSDETVINSLVTFVDIIFENMTERAAGNQDDLTCWLAERAILAAKNNEVDAMNCIITNMFPGDPTELLSADFVMDEDYAVQYPTELLNEQLPSGFPPHRLVLKEGIIVILLRNLNAKEGLCNGTRLIVAKIQPFLLHCKIASGPFASQIVLLPRLDLIVEGDVLPLKWKRRQFPIRPAFAMTINKSQGQTLKKVGVLLREHCFNHGMLYVASSRVGNPNQIMYAVSQSDCGLTRNIVYHEALLEDPFKRPRFSKFGQLSLRSNLSTIMRTPVKKPADELHVIDPPNTTNIQPPTEQDTLLWGVNTNSVPTSELCQIWKKTHEEMELHLESMDQGVAHSCGPDSILDTLHYCIGIPAFDYYLENCDEHGYDPYCQCEVCESYSPFMKSLIFYSDERKGLNNRKQLVSLNNGMWNILCREMPQDFEPKGRGDAAVQDAPKLLAQDTLTSFVGVHRTLSCCAFSMPQTLCPLELTETTEETHESLDELIQKQLLVSSETCPTCGQMLLGGEVKSGEFVVLNLSLETSQGNDEAFLQDIALIGNDSFRFVGCIKHRNDHFFSIVMTEDGEAVAVLDDMKDKAERFPTFLDCLRAKRGNGRILDGICFQVYKKIAQD